MVFCAGTFHRVHRFPSSQALRQSSSSVHLCLFIAAVSSDVSKEERSNRCADSDDDQLDEDIDDDVDDDGEYLEWSDCDDDVYDDKEVSATA